MTFKILSEENNKLIGRKEIRARIAYSGATPDRDSLRKEFKGKNVVVRRIRPEFGSNSAIVDAVIYDSEEIMNKLEAEHIKKRNEEKPKDDASDDASETAGTDKGSPAESSANESANDDKDNKEGDGE